MILNPPAHDDWDPLHPSDIPRVLASYPGFWAIAGGWAADLAVGKQTRPHADIDIQIDRADTNLLHQALPGWHLYLADGVVTPWTEGEEIPESTSDIWCRRADGPWRFQLLLGEFQDGRWYYRRDRTINGPMEQFTMAIGELRVVTPAIQLLYKSKPPHRPKDHHDFANLLPILTATQRRWLVDALAMLYGEHQWLPSLNDKPGSQEIS